MERGDHFHIRRIDILSFFDYGKDDTKTKNGLLATGGKMRMLLYLAAALVVSVWLASCALDRKGGNLFGNSQETGAGGSWGGIRGVGLWTSSDGGSESGGGGASSTTATAGGSGGIGQGGSGGGGEGGQAPTCAPDEKLCGETDCVPKDDPDYGCDDPNCMPCDLENAEATCSGGGACIVNTCSDGFDDCDSDPATGCETDIENDEANCGACDNDCTTNACEAGKCNPLCGPGQKIITTVGASLCWIVPLAQHPTNKFLGVGGLVDQPAGGDISTNDLESFNNCVTPSAADDELVCEFGGLATGTDFELRFYAYNDMAGMNFFAYMCDQAGFPSSDCRGTFEIYNNGVLIAAFTDDNVASTPPPAPWSYYMSGSEILRLRFDNLP